MVGKTTANAALKMAIFNSGKTQRWVAKRAHMTEPRLSQIVRGHAEPSEDEKAALSLALNIIEADLFPVRESVNS